MLEVILIEAFVLSIGSKPICLASLKQSGMSAANIDIGRRVSYGICQEVS